MKQVASNLEQEARGAQKLVIWTDCDREGEHIGSEIERICRKANRNIQVFRARFSVIQERELMRAIHNLVALDHR